MSDEMSENMSDRMPDRLPDRMPGGMSGYMPDRMPEYMSDRMSEYTKYMSKYTSWHVMVGITRSRVFFFAFDFSAVWQRVETTSYTWNPHQRLSSWIKKQNDQTKNYKLRGEDETRPGTGLTLYNLWPITVWCHQSWLARKSTGNSPRCFPWSLPFSLGLSSYS